MTNILERREAKARRKKMYFTGRPCLRGHIAERYTSTGVCTECLKHPDHLLETQKSAISYLEAIKFAKAIDEGVNK